MPGNLNLRHGCCGAQPEASTAREEWFVLLYQFCTLGMPEANSARGRAGLRGVQSLANSLTIGHILGVSFYGRIANACECQTKVEQFNLQEPK